MARPSRAAWTGTARFRLTAWCVGALFAILALLGVGTYVSLDADLLRVSDDKLAVAADQMIAQLPARAGSTATGYWLASRIQNTPHVALPVPATRADTIYYRLVDPRARATVAASPDLRAWPRLLKSLPAAVATRGPRYAYAGYSEETSLRVLTVAVPRSPDALQVAVSWDDTEDSLTAITIAICGACVALLALSAVGCWLLVGRSLAPIGEIVREAEGVSLDYFLPPHIAPRSQSDGEVRQLVASLNDLLARLHESMSVQRQFSADASHELRTPLAILQCEIELSLDRPRDAPEYRRVLESCLEEAQRMRRIVQDLGLLVGNDSEPAERGLGDLAGAGIVDLAALCDKAAAKAQRMADERGISLDVLHQDGACLLHGSEDDLRRVLTNLLDNALAYSRQGAMVIVSTRHADARAIVLEVADTGIGINAGDLPHVFERFYRADKARVNQGGSGLGLSIVQSIARAHGGDVAISSKIGVGTSVLVTLPRALQSSHPFLTSG